MTALTLAGVSHAYFGRTILDRVKLDVLIVEVDVDDFIQVLVDAKAPAADFRACNPVACA